MTSAGDPGTPEGRLTDLLSQARHLGFFGPGPISDQLAHADAFVAAVQGRPGPLLDLGSGGGLPGLAILVRCADLEVVLLEASAKRAEFLRRAVAELGASDRCDVAQGRAEILGRGELRGRFGLVTARSFGPPAPTAECAAPFLRVGGLLVVSEPPEGKDRWPARELAATGLVPGPLLTGPPHLRILEQSTPCPVELPRRDGVPAKRPLF